MLDCKRNVIKILNLSPLELDEMSFWCDYCKFVVLFIFQMR